MSTATKTAASQADVHSTPIAAYIFGGLFLSIWLYGVFFGFGWTGFDVGWFFWGLVGILIAGGLYWARMATEWTRIAIMVVIGIGIGLLVLSAILREDAAIIAAFATATGCGLIASALPRIERP